MAFATANSSSTTTLPQQLSSLDHLHLGSPPSSSQNPSLPLRHPALQARHHLRSFSHDPNAIPDRLPNSSASSTSSPASTPGCIFVHPASPDHHPASSPSPSSPGAASRMGYFCPTPAAERKAGRPLHQKTRSETGLRIGFGPPTQMLRKKSGELVRSSLKPASFTGSASPICGVPAPDSDPGGQWRSAPATPTSGPKVVHFDAHLEHVRHFLAQQRPIAVSRDGSPIETETEGEEEFPFPAMANQNQHAVPLKLVLETPNFPTRLNRIGSQNEDHVRLKTLDLSQDAKSLKGTIEVSNIAFEKLVAIRFTFDNWQTVSEVTAEYIRSISTRFEKTDLFGFTIKLQDVLVRIEERKMEVAVRYSAGGREFWDNNQGQNFQVRFKLLRVGGPSSGGAVKAGQPCPWSVSLRAELDRLVGDDLGLSASASVPPTAALPPPTRRRASAVDALAATTQLKAGTGFSARYDFGMSLKQASGSPGTRNIDLPALVSPVPKGWVNGTGVVQLAASTTTTTTTTRRWAATGARTSPNGMPPSPPNELAEASGNASKESCGAKTEQRQGALGVPQSPSLTDESL